MKTSSILRAALAASLALATGAACAQLPDAAKIQRGAYLMNGILACGNCHGVRGPNGPLADRGLSGGMVFEEPGFTAYASNITPHRETGIGKWTDAEIARAIREGKRPDGSIIGPPMPVEFYRHMAQEDVDAIVAWLRAQPAVGNRVPKSVYRMPLPPGWGPVTTAATAPPAADKIRYGEYLSTIGHCMECHTQRDSKGMLVVADLGAGGRAIPGPWGRSISRNLTSHETGLKNWTDAQIEKAIRTGVNRDGAPYMPPMAFDHYKNINATDMAALIAYLRTLPPREFGGTPAAK